MGQQVNVYRELKFFPGAIITGMPGQGQGRTYYVNNITGTSGASGRSWRHAMAQPSEAITASETYRGLGQGAASTNDYIRNTIVIQGTGTAYTALTALPNYCDMIGLGASPRGNGGGIAAISSTTGADSASSTGVRGMNLYNLQFTGSSSGWAMDLAVVYRSIFETCTFINKSGGGMRIVKGGSITIRDCDFGGDTYDIAYGLYTGDDTAAQNFNQCLVVDNTFKGTTAAIFQSAYWANATRFTNNLAMGGTYGIRDNSSNSDGIQFLAFYDKNFCYGSNSITLNDAGMKINILPNYRCIGNWCSDHGIGHWFVATS